MKKIFFSEIFVLIVSFIFILLFTYTAINKLLRFEGFAYSIRRVPGIFLNPRSIAIGVIAAELIATGLLLVNALRKWGLLLSCLLLLLFSGYIIYMLLVDRNLPCSCGGIMRELTWRQHLLLNLLLSLAAAWAFVVERRRMRRINTSSN